MLYSLSIEILVVAIVLLGFALLGMSMKLLFGRKEGTVKSSCKIYTDKSTMGCACGGMCLNEDTAEK